MGNHGGPSQPFDQSRPLPPALPPQVSKIRDPTRPLRPTLGERGPGTMWSHPQKPCTPSAAAETTLDRCPEKSLVWTPASLTTPNTHSLPSLREGVLTKMSLFFNKGRIGLGKESTTFSSGLLFLPWCRVWDTGSSFWRRSLENRDRSPPSSGLKSATSPPCCSPQCEHTSVGPLSHVLSPPSQRLKKGR